MTIHELWKSITFFIFKTSLVIAPPPPRTAYKNRYVAHPLLYFYGIIEFGSMTFHYLLNLVRFWSFFWVILTGFLLAFCWFSLLRLDFDGFCLNVGRFWLGLNGFFWVWLGFDWVWVRASFTSNSLSNANYK